MLDIAWVVSAAAQAILLFRTALALRDWGALAAWLLASLAQDVLLLIARASGSQTTYYRSWLLTEAVVLVLLLWTTYDAYRRRAERRLQVGQVGIWITSVAVVFSVAWYLANAPSIRWDEHLQEAIRLRGLMLIGLGGSAALVLGIYAVFPCPTEPVVIRHHTILTAYLTVRALQAWAHTLVRRDQLASIDMLALSCSAVLFLLWAWIIGPIPKNPPPQRGPDADSLDSQQAQMIAMLNRARRPRPGGTDA